MTSAVRAIAHARRALASTTAWPEAGGRAVACAISGSVVALSAGVGHDEPGRRGVGKRRPHTPMTRRT